MTTQPLAKGLRNVVLDTTESSFIDGEEGILLYRGYSIHDLAAHSSFEEVCYLLLYGSLPGREELKALDTRLRVARVLPAPVIDVIRIVQRAHPIDILRTAVSALAAFDPDTADASLDAVRRKSERLTAQFPTIVAAHDRIRRGLAPVAPRDDLSHAAMLTRAAGPDNFAFFTQYIGLLGGIEDGIVDAFRNGAGLSYSAYPKFQTIQGEESGAVYDATLIQSTLPLVPGLVERLERGIDVVDVGCGAGHAINLMAQAYPNSRFTGYDFSEEGVAFGRAEAAEKGLTNLKFEVQDIAQLSGPPRFDLITAFDTIHDQAAPRRVLKSIYEALRPDGDFLCVDIAGSSNLEDNIGNPMAPLLFTFSVFHCMTVSLAQGGEGLGTMWGEQKAHELFREAGFTQVETRNVEGDVFNNYYLLRK